MYVNDTYDGVAFQNPSITTVACTTGAGQTYTGSVNTLTVFDYQYKGSVPSSFIPAVRGDTYVFRFVATFQDGSTASASATVTAS